MPTFTAIILAAFVGYALGWYRGMIEGNFALLLFMATVVSGLYWLAEKFYFLPRRKAAAQSLLNAESADLSAATESILRQPWWLDWTAGLFPVIVSVFFLRSFLFEPFKIPSGSMIPTLQVGDLILVNKFHYGIRLPVLNTKITQGNPVQRGDVMVFRYPVQPSIDYIKRVIGVPGDEVRYINKQLSINGVLVEKNTMPEFIDREEIMGNVQYVKRSQFEENFPTGSSPSDAGPLKKVHILNYPERPSGVFGADNFQGKDNCSYSVEGFTCKVPAGHYFMMGDNRDNSQDSRYWGFVPDENIVGKAFFVWMNFGNLDRIGSFN
jgi:signal peptidase I